MRITFDTNSLMDLFQPKAQQRAELQPAAERVHNALSTGSVQGFFSETLLTLEGVQRCDRQKVFGSTRVVSRTTCTGPNRIQTTIDITQHRKPLNRQYSRMVQAARACGLRALRAPSRLGWFRTSDDDGTLFAPDGSVTELVARMDIANEIATKLGERGVGYARAVALGRQFANCDDPIRPALWFEGLLSASKRAVTRAIAEWADGDSVASHCGYGNDVFCTADNASNAASPSVLDSANRQWLVDTFGIRFTTLDRLAVMIDG